MPQQTELIATEDWCADDTESDCMSDDDFELDELADDEIDELPEDKSDVLASNTVPVWRLIEMSRESRFLERELADFDDYDKIDNFSGGETENYMH